jgi:hypothetical protein
MMENLDNGLRQLITWLATKWNGVIGFVASLGTGGGALASKTHLQNTIEIHNKKVAILHENNNIYFEQINQSDSLRAIIDSLRVIAESGAIEKTKIVVSLSQYLTVGMIILSMTVSVLTIVGWYWKMCDRREAKLLKSYENLNTD